MANVKFSPLIAEARGAVGSVVFSKNTYSNYVRDRVIPANPNTPEQITYRTAMTTISQRWGTLTATRRQRWEAQARNLSRTNIFGDQVHLNGFNWYLKANLNRNAVGFPIIDDPGVYFPIDQVRLLTIDANTTAGTLNITFDWPFNFFTRGAVYATPELSPGVNFVKSEYRLIFSLLSTGAPPRNIAAAYITQFGALPAAGKKIFIRLRMINFITGLSSVYSVQSTIAY